MAWSAARMEIRMPRNTGGLDSQGPLFWYSNPGTRNSAETAVLRPFVDWDRFEFRWQSHQSPELEKSNIRGNKYVLDFNERGDLIHQDFTHKKWFSNREGVCLELLSSPNISSWRALSWAEETCVCGVEVGDEFDALTFFSLPRNPSGVDLFSPVGRIQLPGHASEIRVYSKEATKTSERGFVLVMVDEDSDSWHLVDICRTSSGDPFKLKRSQSFGLPKAKPGRGIPRFQFHEGALEVSWQEISPQTNLIVSRHLEVWRWNEDATPWWDRTPVSSKHDFLASPDEQTDPHETHFAVRLLRWDLATITVWNPTAVISNDDSDTWTEYWDLQTNARIPSIGLVLNGDLFVDLKQDVAWLCKRTGDQKSYGTMLALRFVPLTREFPILEGYAQNVLHVFGQLPLFKQSLLKYRLAHDTSAKIFLPNL